MYRHQSECKKEPFNKLQSKLNNYFVGKKRTVREVIELYDLKVDEKENLMS